MSFFLTGPKFVVPILGFVQENPDVEKDQEASGLRTPSGPTCVSVDIRGG